MMYFREHMHQTNNFFSLNKTQNKGCLAVFNLSFSLVQTISSHQPS